MSAAAFTFGSFGDIVAVLQLAWQIRAALDEATGSRAEMRTFVADIDAFVTAVQQIQTSVERRRKTMRPDVINAIGAALARCREALQHIQRRIDKAQKQMTSSVWRKYWATAAWSILGDKKDIEDLRRRLVDQVNLIQTYLALSEAHDQDMILHHMELNGTTIRRIYDSVQDIQTRFDVGIPSFRFFDPDSRTYYAPLARSSLQRLNDVLIALDGRDILSWIESERSMPWEQALNANQNKRSLQITSEVDFECLFFREAAFGGWQVLVHDVPVYNCILDDARIFKHLLERRHTIGEPCNCTTRHCSVLHQEYLQRQKNRRYRARLYTVAARLLRDRVLELEPDTDKAELYNSLYQAFLRVPSPEFVRSDLMPAISSGALMSPSAMWELLQAAPVHISTDRLMLMGTNDERTLLRLRSDRMNPKVHSLLIATGIDGDVELRGEDEISELSDDDDLQIGVVLAPDGRTEYIEMKIGLSVTEKPINL